MTIKLKQSTASQEIPLGPFVDSTDGNTEESGLTIANTDIKLWKMGATTLASKNSGGATYISNGVYYCVLDATDTNTLGGLVVFVHVSGALAVRVECEVLAANVYDSLIAASDNLQVDTVQVTGTAQTAGDLMGSLGEENVAAATGDPGTTVSTLAYLKQLVNVLIGTAGITTFPAAANPANAVSLAEVIRSIHANLGSPSDLGSGATIKDNLIDIENETDDIGAAGAGLTSIPNSGGVTTLLTRIPSGLFTGITSLAQWLGLLAGKQVGDTTARTEVRATGAGSGTFDETTDSLEAIKDAGGGGPTAADIADAVWEEQIADHSGTTGSTAESLNAAGGAGDPWNTALPGAYASGKAGNILGNYLTGDVYARVGAPAGASVSADIAAVKSDSAAILVDTGTTLDAALAVVDANVDTLISRITSTLFTGITSLAQWLGLLAGKQVGNSTARTEVRATGAGSGTFDETTDSQEAIRDKEADIETDTQDLQSRTPAALVSGRMDASLGSIAAGVDLSATMKTSVNTEVLDVLNVDTFAEPTGAPAATSTLAQKVGYLFMALRNKLTVTASAKTFFDDGGSAEWSKALSDDTTTYTEAEGA